MYCPKCGTEIPDTSTFCLKCGNKVIDPEQILRSHRTSNILFITTIAVVILGIAALYLLLRNHESEDAKLAVNNRPSPSPSVSPSPSPSPSVSPSPSPSPLTDIRTVNFKKMNYPLGSARVAGGDSTVDVAYGDLDGDGIEEAAINLTYTLGDNKPLSRGFVYAVKEGKLQRVTEFVGGEKATGGIVKMHIAETKLEVERCRKDEAEGGQIIETTTYQLTDGALKETGEKKKRKTETCS